MTKLEGCPGEEVAGLVADLDRMSASYVTLAGCRNHLMDRAAKALSTLSAEREAMEGALKDLHSIRDSELRTLASVEAHNDALLGALKPFAAYVDAMDAYGMLHAGKLAKPELIVASVQTEMNHSAVLYWRDFVRAKDALVALRPDQGGGE